MRQRPPLPVLALLIGLALLLGGLAACGGGSDGAERSGAAGSAAVAPEPAAADAPASDARASDDSAGQDSRAATEDVADDRASSAPGALAPSVISTGGVALAADDVAAARRAATGVATGLGGSVADDSTQVDTDGRALSSVLTLRVPSARFRAAMERLEDVGDLRSSSTSSEDVTTQVLDTAARIRVQRASIARISTLMRRAGSLADVVRVERELATRQADLESLLRQRDYLADQTSLATISVTIERTGTVPDDTRRTGFLGGLRSGWDAFTDAASGAATAAGAAVPFVGLLLVLAALGWVPMRRRARGRAGAQASG